MTDQIVVGTRHVETERWYTKEGAESTGPHPGPWQPAGARPQLSMVWKDRKNTIPLSAVDWDGCTARVKT